MMIPIHPHMQGFGERPGDATSAGFLDRLNSEMYGARSCSAAPPLMVENGPLGMMISIDESLMRPQRILLTADLASGSSAAATLIGFNFASLKPTEPGETITVYDSFGIPNGTRVGKKGEYGFAVYFPDSQRWEILLFTAARLFDDYFPAYISARTTVSGIYSYSWTEYEFTAVNIAPTSKSNGRSGTSTSWPLTEVNNRVVAVGSLVWARRSFKPASVGQAVLTKTLAGNNSGGATAFSLYVDSCTGGTYTVTFDGSTSATIAYNASAATTKAAIEATTSGLTLSSFSGAGTLASPWTFTVTSDPADHTAYVTNDGLRDGSGFAFAAPDGTVLLWNWTAIKSTDYDPAVGEAVPFNYDAANRTARFPVTAAANDRIMLVPLYSTGGFKVILSGVLADGATGYNLNGVAATGNNLGTGFGTGEGAYIFTYSGDATVGWVCERPLA